MLTQNDGESTGFNPKVLEYTATTSNATNKVTATATDTEAVILITVNDQEHENGTSAEWEEGENIVSITVTIGEKETVYTVVVNKE